MAEIKFEDALKKLEKIVEDLENGSLSLDGALEKYNEGIELSRLCTKKLDAAKKKVEILLKSADGSVELKPFDESTAEEEEKSQSDTKKKRAKGDTGLF
jgi:exodeoxyribonuclease VII small subunit